MGVSKTKFLDQIKHFEEVRITSNLEGNDEVIKYYTLVTLSYLLVLKIPKFDLHFAVLLT